MNAFARSLAGGVLVLVVAGVLGVAHNAVRSSRVPLVVSLPGGASDGGDASPGLASSTAPATGAAAGTDTAAAAALARRVRAGAVVLLDARSPDAFAEGHIPGAINVPYDRLAEYLGVLQERVMPDDSVVCYCWSPSCDFSDQLADELRLMGYTAVTVFEGGWEAWTGADMPVETGGEGE